MISFVVTLVLSYLLFDFLSQPYMGLVVGIPLMSVYVRTCSLIEDKGLLVTSIASLVMQFVYMRIAMLGWSPQSAGFFLGLVAPLGAVVALSGAEKWLRWIVFVALLAIVADLYTKLDSTIPEFLAAFAFLSVSVYGLVDFLTPSSTSTSSNQQSSYDKALNEYDESGYYQSWKHEIESGKATKADRELWDLYHNS